MTAVKSPQDIERATKLMADISEIDKKIHALMLEKLEVQRELLGVKIAPFKIGDIALVEIPSGRSKKWQVCVLECEEGTLFARPFKADGELSGRHFSIIAPKGNYLDYLKEVHN